MRVRAAAWCPRCCSRTTAHRPVIRPPARAHSLLLRQRPVPRSGHRRHPVWCGFAYCGEGAGSSHAAVALHMRRSELSTQHEQAASALPWHLKKRVQAHAVQQVLR
jgi:hypothetical protein